MLERPGGEGEQVRIYSDMIAELTFWRIVSFWSNGSRGIYSEWTCEECAKRAFREVEPNEHCSYALIEFSPRGVERKEVGEG